MLVFRMEPAVVYGLFAIVAAIVATFVGIAAADFAAEITPGEASD